MVDRYLTQEEIDVQVKAMNGENPYETAPEMKYDNENKLKHGKYYEQETNTVMIYQHGTLISCIFYNEKAGKVVLEFQEVPTTPYLRSISWNEWREMKTRYEQ